MKDKKRIQTFNEHQKNLNISDVRERFITEETVTPKEVIKHEKNTLSGNWLCWIPDTPQAYYYPTKKMAKEFCDKVNKAFALGELKIDDRERVVKVNVSIQKQVDK